MKATDLINVRQVSKLLTGKEGTIRADYMKHLTWTKYRKAIKELTDFLEGWIERWEK